MGGPGGPGGNRGEMLADLGEETREKVQTIMEQERNGEITCEERQTQLKELGIEFHGRAMKP